MLIALSVLWGGSFFFNGVAVRELPSLTIILLRVGIAALTLWAVRMLLNIRRPRMKGLWPAFFGIGLFEQCHSLRAIRLGAAPYREWLGRDPQRHHAAFHGAGCAFSNAR